LHYAISPELPHTVIFHRVFAKKILNAIAIPFYRAMQRRARYCYVRQVVCPSVRPWRWSIVIT